MRRVRNSRSQRQEAELDITAFMNLMIVLVPVLLLGMVFSQITVLDLKLPEAAAGDAPEQQKIELLILDDSMQVNYPQGILLKRIPQILVAADDKTDAGGQQPVVEERAEEIVEKSAETTVEKRHDFKMLSLVLQEVKRQLREKGLENRSITILSEPMTTYQTIISTMDTVRSYKTVVAVSVVDAELFPDVSFGDAPVAMITPATGDSQ